MKRIAATAAVIFGLLAIPTAAMASTTSDGPGSGSGYGVTGYLQPDRCYYGWHKVHHHHYSKYFEWWRHGREYQNVFCPFPRQIPLPQQGQQQSQSQQCQSSGQTLTFSVAANSSAFTEVSGPQLSPTDEFVYDGNTYTVMTVNPGADQFTAFVNNFLFTNHGGAITDAAGAMICGAGSSSSYN